MKLHLCTVPNVGIVGAGVTKSQRHPRTDVLKAGCSKHTKRVQCASFRCNAPATKAVYGQYKVKGHSKQTAYAHVTML